MPCAEGSMPYTSGLSSYRDTCCSVIRSMSRHRFGGGAPARSHLCTACNETPQRRAISTVPAVPSLATVSAAFTARCMGDSFINNKSEWAMEQLNHRFIYKVNPGVVHPAGNALDNQPMVSEVGQVIRDALRVERRTQAWLAEECGVSENAVSKWIRTGKISRENLARLSKALRLPIDSLVQGYPGPTVVKDGVGAYTARPAGVPVISWVQAGHWADMDDGSPLDAAEEWLPCPAPHGPRAFALRVRGESMYNPHGRPSFQDGDLIFVDPDKAVENKSLVIVRLHDSNEATFKQLVIDGPHSYLKALNPGWPTPMIEVNHTASVCGVVIFKGEQL